MITEIFLASSALDKINDVDFGKSIKDKLIIHISNCSASTFGDEHSVYFYVSKPQQGISLWLIGTFVLLKVTDEYRVAFVANANFMETPNRQDFLLVEKEADKLLHSMNNMLSSFKEMVYNTASSDLPVSIKVEH